MATMRDIKRRKSSIESTEQITKAMKLVATVKLQKSRTKAENSRLYFNLMYQTIQEMLKKSTGIRHRYLKSGDSKKKAVIVVSSNRGLAGGYNSNIIRLVTESGIPKEDALIFAIGRKGRDGLARKGYEIKADYSDVIDEPLYSDAQQISKELLAMFEKNEIGEIYLAYTAFKNTVSQIPTFLQLLPQGAGRVYLPVLQPDRDDGCGGKCGSAVIIPGNAEGSEDQAGEAVFKACRT